jgi:hypothetical protein
MRRRFRPDAVIVRPVQPPELEVRDISVGTVRATGTYIGLILQTEAPQDRAMILADVMHCLGITPEEVAEHYKRGMS